MHFLKKSKARFVKQLIELIGFCIPFEYKIQKNVLLPALNNLKLASEPSQSSKAIITFYILILHIHHTFSKRTYQCKKARNQQRCEQKLIKN